MDARLPQKPFAAGTETEPSPPADGREAWAAWRDGLQRSERRQSVFGTVRYSRWSPFRGLLWAIDVGLRLVGLHARGRRNATDIAMIGLELPFPDLPAAFDGFRILHISDPHFDALPDVHQRALTLIQDLDADLCVLGGDYLMRHGGPHAHILPHLESLLDAVRLRHGAVAILGNHDPSGMVQMLEGLGVRVLLNESLSLERQGQHIHLTGTDDVHHFHTPAAQRALDAAPEGFRIALIHSAELAGEAAERGFRLYLCGHTHGGQICLPGGRPVVTHLRVHKGYARGLWRHGGMVGYTSCGMGVSGVPVRFNSRGEVTVVTLRRADQLEAPNQ